MLFNKNSVRKVNDKKVLHKVGKNWKVVSLALLMAIGGGAVATHANANADATNNFDVNPEAQQIASNKFINSGYVAPSSAASSKSAQPAKPASNISYLNTYGGSAASYHAKAQSDASNYNANNAVVQHYVNSLNSEFPTQTSSLNSDYDSAADQTSADQSNQNSYSAIAAQSDWSSEVSSLAAKANMTSSAYIESVGASASAYADDVTNGASLNSEMSSVGSYAQLIKDINSNSNIRQAYKLKKVSADAQLNIADAYATNASNIASDVATQSEKNENSLYANQNALATESANEAIAIINSGADNNFVQSIANKNGHQQYANSSSVSDVISAMASAYNDGNIWSYSATTTISNASAGDYFITSSAADGPNSENVQYIDLGVNYPKLPNNVKWTGGPNYGVSFAATSAGGVAQFAASNSNDLVRDVLDTAAELKYSAENHSLTTNINNEKNAIAKYNNQSVSASEGVQKAANSVTSAKSNETAYAILGGNTAPTMSQLFGHEGTYITSGTFGSNSTIRNVSTLGTDADSITSINNGLKDLLGNNNVVNAALHAAGDGNLASERTTVSQLNDAISKIKPAINNINSYVHGLSRTNASDIVNGSSQLTVKLFSNTPAGPDKGKGLVQQFTSGVEGAIASYLNSDASKINDVLGINVGSTNPSSVDTNYGNTVVGSTKFNNINSGKRSDFDSSVRHGQYDTGILNDNTDDQAENAAVDLASSAVSADVNNPALNTTPADYSAEVSEVNSVSNSVSTSFASASSASASYSTATDENVALASSYADSYSAVVNADKTNQSAAKANLDDFYLGHADNRFSNALSSANSEASAVPNDNALAYANGLHVYNYGPKYITTIKNAAIHTNANYGKFGDRKIASVPAGTKLTVLGNGFTLNGGVVYHVNYKGADGFITNLPSYVRYSYLTPGDISINVNKNTSIHSDGNFTGKNNVGMVKAGTTLKGTVYSVDGIRGGFTRMAFPYKGNTYYITTNTDYVSVNNNDANNSNYDNANNNGTAPTNHVIFGK